MLKFYTVIWSFDAMEDLEEINIRIAKQSPQNAQMVVDKLVELGETLATTPNAHRREPKMPNHRFLPKWNFKIIFEVNEGQNQVEIKKVFTTLQDPVKLPL